MFTKRRRFSVIALSLRILSRGIATPCGHLSKTQPFKFKRTKLSSCSSQLSHAIHVVCFPLDLFTANGAAGSEQTQVGLGVNDATWFHWALLVQAEDLTVHQAHPEKACSDFCCSLCHRWGTKSILLNVKQLWCQWIDWKLIVELCNDISILSDVNFIASPPSMVAAGSVVAAVQGLDLKSLDASFSSQNLTNLLSQVIGSDPVCRHNLIQHEFQWFFHAYSSSTVFRRTACGHVKSR